MANFNIAVLSGDGIGPEVVNEAIKVLNAIGDRFEHTFNFEEALIGGCAIDSTGSPLPAETIELCKRSYAVLLGAVGGTKWDALPGNVRPEAGLLGIRAALGLYANLRPTKVYEPLKNASPLNSKIVKDGIDILVVRELTGGMYFGKKGRYQDEVLGECAFDTEVYSEKEVERIARFSFEAARKRSKKLVSVDKANVLESSRLWRSVVMKISKEYEDVELEHMYVDNASMQLVKRPSYFDVILASNMFGDILSDEAAIISGSIGMLPSASIGDCGVGLYEPVHGSAPDIAGRDLANPLATILSVAMMLRYSFNLDEEAKAIEAAVDKVLADGYRTADIKEEGDSMVGCTKMGDLVKNYCYLSE